MKAKELGQGFIDLTYLDDEGNVSEYYEDWDEDGLSAATGKPEYHYNYGDNVAWDAIEEIFYVYSGDPIVQEIAGSRVTLEQQVGGEGEGDEYFLVFKVDNPDGSVQYFRKDGYYTSYEGTGWDSGELHEVKLVQRLVNFYE